MRLPLKNPEFNSLPGLKPLVPSSSLPDSCELRAASYSHFQVNGRWLHQGRTSSSSSVSELYVASDSSSSLFPSLQVKRAEILVAPPPLALESGNWRARSPSSHLWPPQDSTPRCLACRGAPGCGAARRPEPRPRGSPSPRSCRRQTPGEERRWGQREEGEQLAASNRKLVVGTSNVKTAKKVVEIVQKEMREVIAVTLRTKR